MCEVLLSDAFNVCFGPSSGPEIVVFNRFKERLTELNHRQVEQRQPPIISASESVKTFILQHCQKDYPGEDYREFN